MKKTLFTLAMALSCTVVMASGYVTNTNQSIQFIRTASRNASLDIDAAYFNPAAAALMNDGFKLQYGHQVVSQKRTTTDDFALLSRHEFEGKVFVPAYPTIDAMYKKNKLAFSFHFGPIGGGGNAKYEKGLASFERNFCVIPAAISATGAAMGVGCDQYSVDINFTGSSIILGGQIGAAYSVMDNLSVGVGARLSYQKNKYEGSIKNVMINPKGLVFDGSMISAPGFFQGLAAMPQLESLKPTLLYYAAATAGMEVDATQSGLGITPIVSVDYKLNDKFNFAARYEFNTKLELTNKSDADKDAGGMFKNDSTFRKDIPGILSLGASYNILPNLRTMLSYTLYFDKQADFNGKEKLFDGNTMDFALSFEYDVTNMLTLSCGYARSQTGASAEFQSDMDFALSSNTFGFGGKVKVNDKLDVDFGVMAGMYEKMEKKSVDKTTGLSHTETFGRTNKIFSAGVSYRF